MGNFKSRSAPEQVHHVFRGGWVFFFSFWHLPAFWLLLFFFGFLAFVGFLAFRLHLLLASVGLLALLASQHIGE